MASANEHLVTPGTLPYYKRATVDGLRDQLRDNNLPSKGRKYELYRRLQDAGIMLYTDDRPDHAPDSPPHSEDSDDDRQNWLNDPDIDDIVERRRSQRERRLKAIASGNGGGDNRAGGSGQGRGKGKRTRDEVDNDDDGDSSHDGDNDGDQGPPRQRPRLIGSGLPAELQVQLITTLHPSALWNLITAAPDAYLSNDPTGINAILVEANYQRRLDYPGGVPAPPPPPPGGPAAPGQVTVVGPVGQVAVGPGMVAVGGMVIQINVAQVQAPFGFDRPISLLEWAGRRAMTDSQFRAANRTRIRRVINAYLAVYGAAEPPAGANNARDDILYYFRDRADLAGQETIIGRAARLNLLHVVHLLIAHGANVNEVVSGRSVVDEVAADISTDQLHLQCLFAVLAAGANVANLDQGTLDEVSALVRNVTGDPNWEDNADFEWPRINNLLALTGRQFLADDRSPNEERTLVAMFLLWEGHDNYPSFV